MERLGGDTLSDDYPAPLTPDPEQPSRADWFWCADCGALKPAWHNHGDVLEAMPREQLLELCRKQNLFIACEDVGSTRFEDLAAAMTRGRAGG